MNRRRFLQASVAASVGFPAIVRGVSPNSKIVVAVIGASRNATGGNGRGAELAVGLAGLRNVEVAAICDVDEQHLAKAVEAVEAKSTNKVRGERDFRRVLEDKAIDAVAIATPDHWHAPLGILACAAGKHAYVEKPCCHNPREGELLVEAARKYDRRVQHGTQRRSWPGIQEAMAKLREGAIGRVMSARAYYFANRPTIGQGKVVPVPAGLDWALWQGPAPEREFHDNYVPYHCHWFWHWGTGELGNNGVHMIDLCRWGLGADFASRVTSGGAKLRFAGDDQQTPDTHSVTFDFPGQTLGWECRSWAARTPADPRHDVAFYGETGALYITGGAYSICGLDGKEIAKGSGPAGNDVHLQNFCDAIRGEAKLNAEIEEGYKSALLCHLGNIAHRTGRTVNLEKGRIINDADAARLWTREYRPGWSVEPPQMGI